MAKVCTMIVMFLFSNGYRRLPPSPMAYHSVLRFERGLFAITNDVLGRVLLGPSRVKILILTAVSASSHHGSGYPGTRPSLLPCITIIMTAPFVLQSALSLLLSRPIAA